MTKKTERMPPKGKKKAAKKSGNKGGGDDSDFDEAPGGSSGAASVGAIVNLLVGEVSKVEKVPNGTLLKCFVEVPDRNDDAFIVTSGKVEVGQKVVVALAPCQLPNGIKVFLFLLSRLW